MELEKLIQLFIYIHAGFGGIALLTGGIALGTKKGSSVHKKTGLIFYYSMLISALFSFVISVMPNHESPFLFCIGLFSTYFLLSGYRSLRFKQPQFNFTLDKGIAYSITCIGVIMILYPILFYGRFNIILTVFGLMSIWLGVQDIRLYKHIEKAKTNWLQLHVSKITGGYIAAVSAFFVVNQILPGIWNWFTPGIIGSFYITYWMRKLNTPKT